MLSEKKFSQLAAGLIKSLERKYRKYKTKINLEVISYEDMRYGVYRTILNNQLCLGMVYNDKNDHSIVIIKAPELSQLTLMLLLHELGHVVDYYNKKETLSEEDFINYTYNEMGDDGEENDANINALKLLKRLEISREDKIKTLLCGHCLLQAGEYCEERNIWLYDMIDQANWSDRKLNETADFIHERVTFYSNP